MTQLYQDELAQLYDVAVPDWPGEIDFYRQLIQQVPLEQRSVLEIACGTGRVTVQLAGADVSITGIDLSDEMLAIARSKSTALSNVRWILADMRSFELPETFGLAIVPAYSFQLLLTAADQAACLRQIARHLSSGACLALHLEHHDPEWLASLPTDDFTPFEASGETIHPISGQRIRVSYAWAYNPESRSVSVTIRYEIIEDSGRIAPCTDRGPLSMHCTSPSELQDQLSAAGFDTESIVGDFRNQPYDSNSDEIIWIARRM
jgi:ubiquinone/menaquinone biosynthesis C-methylase UbiE